MLLTNAEQVALCRKWQEHQDISARNTLIMSLEGLVTKIVRENDYVTFEDAYQNAMVRLHRATDLFRCDGDVRFSSYARYHIMHGVFDTMCEDDSLNRKRHQIHRKNRTLRHQAELERMGVPTVRAAQIAYEEENPYYNGEIHTRGGDIDKLEVQPQEYEKVDLSKILDPNVRMVLRLRNGYYGGTWKHKDLGRIYGVTKQRIEQLQRKGLKHLKDLYAHN